MRYLRNLSDTRYIYFLTEGIYLILLGKLIVFGFFLLLTSLHEHKELIALERCLLRVRSELGIIFNSW